MGELTALITGASSGIGYVVSKQLAAAGVKVVATARRTEKLAALVKEIEEAGGTAAYTSCDVSDPESLAAAFAFAEQQYGSISFVYANAGIEGVLGGDTSLTTMDDSVVKKLCDINIAGAIATLKHAVISFRKSGGGKVVFSSSVASVFNQRFAEICQSASPEDGFSQMIPYSTTKAALDHVVKLAAGAYAREKIDVYALNYGTFESEMLSRGKDSGMEGMDAFNPYFKTDSGKPGSIAQVILAILDGTSQWKSGDIVVVDHDATIDGNLFYDAKFGGNSGSDENMGWPGADILKQNMKDTTGTKTYSSE